MRVSKYKYQIADATNVDDWSEEIVSGRIVTLLAQYQLGINCTCIFKEVFTRFTDLRIVACIAWYLLEDGSR